MGLIRYLINETVRRWKKSFLTGTESVKYASGRFVTVTGKTNDDIYTTHNIDKAVGMSLSQIHFILKRMCKILSSKWIPNISADDQNGCEGSSESSQPQQENIIIDRSFLYYFST